jgi:nitrous oxide reductase accessory protein NosL
MVCDKNGVDLEMLLEDGAPYYKIQADRYGCNRCGATVLVGFADKPFAQHFEKDYGEKIVEMQAEFASP